MIYVVSHLSIAEAATIINVVIAFVQVTLPASLVLLVIHFMSRTNQAVAWSSLGQVLHSSIWPVLLRSDSTSRKSTGFAVPTISILITACTVLVAVVGVILPLGLHDGPPFIDHPKYVTANYLPDDSPLALATTPNRYKYLYGRRPCGRTEFPPCLNITAKSQNTPTASAVQIFNSTPQGPFTLQYRRFYNEVPDLGTLYSSSGLPGTVQSFLQQDSIFAVEGLIVDMTTDHPGIGFWNTTVPEADHGGTWSQDVLWLKPLTKCIHTNLTLSYEMTGSSGPFQDKYNLTDHGGFYDLTPDFPPLNRDGQNINLSRRAYRSAVLSNFIAMVYLNASRESSFEGKNYTIIYNLTSGISLSSLTLGHITPLPLSYLNGTMESDSFTSTACQGFEGSDIANKSNIHVSCGAFLGTPLRTDGGDPEDFSEGSRWKQDIHVCASTTRASIQKITFSSNDLRNLRNLRISRKAAGQTVLWGIEKGNFKIRSIDLMWGIVDDIYENDSSIWAIRSEGLYLPAGRSAFDVTTLPSGSAHAAHETIWKQIYEAAFSRDNSYLVDYLGTFDYAMRRKYQAIVEQNPVNGYASIRNIVWTDMMLNSVVGTATNATAFFSASKPSIEYRMPFAIPGFILLAIWLPSFLLAIVLIGMGALRLDYMRDVLNHTSIGRAVVGASSLRDENSSNQPELFVPADSSSETAHDGKDVWVGSEATPVTLFLDRGSTYEMVPLESTGRH